MKFNTLDIIVVVIAVIFLIAGLRKGFVKAFFKLLGTFGSLILAIFLCKYMCNLICLTTFDEWLVQQLGGAFNGMGASMYIVVGADGQAALVEALTGGGIPSFISGWIAPSMIALIPEGGYFTVSTLLGAYIGQMIVIVIAFIILFIACKIVFGLIKRLFDALIKIKFFKFFDKLFGLAFGFAKAALLVMVVFFCMSFFIEHPNMAVVKNEIEESTITKIAYDYNVVTMLGDYTGVNDYIRELLGKIGL